MTDTKFSPELTQFLSSTLEQLKSMNPDFAEIMDLAYQGEITEAEAIARMLILLAETPELNNHLVDMFSITPKDDPNTEALEALESYTEGSFTGFIEKRDNFYQINPLYQGAIAERLQFDGDIPELRTGRVIVDESFQPAISVDTEALSTIAIGNSILVEQETLRQEIVDHQELLANTLDSELHLLQESSQTGLVTTSQTEDLLSKYNDPSNDPPRYKRGEIPLPVKVDPQGSALAMLSPEQKKKAVWSVVSTTQGRRSAVKPIAKKVVSSLEALGFRVETVKSDVMEPWAEVSWSMQLDGPQALRSDFNYVGMASQVLSQKIERVLSAEINEQGTPCPVYIEVSTLDRVADRTFGWTIGIWR